MVNFDILHTTLWYSELLEYCQSTWIPLFHYLVSVVGHLYHEHVFLLHKLAKFIILVLHPWVHFIFVVGEECLDFISMSIEISSQLEVRLVAVILYFE